MSGATGTQYFPLFRTGSPGLFTNRKTFWVTQEGSRYLFYNKDGNLSESGTDFQEKMQALLDSMVHGDWFHFDFDTIRPELHNPIEPPYSTAGTTVMGVSMKGNKGHRSSGASVHGTQFIYASDFPTQRSAIEALSPESDSTNYVVLEMDGFSFDNRSFGKAYQAGAMNTNILGTSTIIDAGAIKIRNSADYAGQGIQIRNIHTMFIWRALHLEGSIVTGMFENFFTEDDTGDPTAALAFVGDSLVLLNSLSVPSGFNSTVKYSFFKNFKRFGQGRYNNWLRMQSGNYNTFVDIFPDGGLFEEAVFNLDNSQDILIDSGNILASNAFYHLQTLDTNTIPSTDNRKGGTLYLNGTGCTDNRFHDCLLTNYPAMVKMAGGARRNYVQMAPYVSGTALIDDMGAGDGNVVHLIGGHKDTAGLETVTAYSQIADVVDLRQHPFPLMGFVGKRKIGIDYCNTVTPQGFGLLSYVTNLGTPAVASTVDGQYISFPGSAGANQNYGRIMNSADTNQLPSFARHRNPSLTATIEFISAKLSAERMAIGFINNIPTLTTGACVSDTLLGSTDIGILVGYRTTDTTYKVFTNNASTMTVAADTGVTVDTGIHTVRIWASEGATGTNNKWRVQMETIDPIEINNSNIPSSSAVIYPVILAGRSTAAGFFRFRGWQLESL